MHLLCYWVHYACKKLPWGFCDGIMEHKGGKYYTHPGWKIADYAAVGGNWKLTLFTDPAGWTSCRPFLLCSNDNAWRFWSGLSLGCITTKVTLMILLARQVMVDEQFWHLPSVLCCYWFTICLSLWKSAEKMRTRACELAKDQSWKCECRSCPKWSTDRSPLKSWQVWCSAFFMLRCSSVV